MWACYKGNKRLYDIYTTMKQRCYNKNHKKYKHYGGRGIKVCSEWLESYSNFYEWAINNGYSDNLTLDRIDTNGNYEPNNCRWATQKEQQNNKRTNTNITYNGETHNLKQWAEIKGINYKALWKRLHDGWSVERALTTPQKARNKK